MQEIGKLAIQAKGALSQQSRSNAPALPASTTRAPVYFDRQTDIDLPQLYSAWKPDNGPREIRRALTGTERQMLTVRANELRAALHPYLPDERNDVEASIAAMLGGFRSMRQEGDSAEGIVVVLAGVLRRFPAWAIAKGCMKISRNDAGLDPRFAPNDTEIHRVVDNIVREHRQTLERVEGLLVAPVEVRNALPKPAERPHSDIRPSGAEPFAPLIDRKPPDGKHAARVAADLAARRASFQQAAE
jgi:hypothetical protein